MPFMMKKSKDEIRFVVSGLLCQRLCDWEAALDEVVLNEQLTTGSFRGRWRVDDEEWLEMMREMKARGVIAPWYGVGSRSACVYVFKPKHKGCVIRVEHTVAEESIEFSDETAALREIEMPEPWMVFRIDGQEYVNLQEWEYWVDEQALTSRYVYQFGRVCLGRLGYTVGVKDTATDSWVDVTDYDDW